MTTKFLLRHFCLAAYTAAFPLSVTLAQTAHYAGTTTVLASSLSSPSGVAVGSGNVVYVVDTGNNRILKEVPSGSAFTQTVITNSALSSPAAVAVDAAGNLYVVNGGTTNNLVKLTLSGSTYTGSVISASVGRPVGIAVTADGTALYVTDTQNSQIFQFSYSSGSYVQRLTVTAGISGPYGVFVDSSNNWYVAASGSQAVFTHTAGFSPAAFNGTNLVNTGGSPRALTLDSAGDVFVTTASGLLVEVANTSSGYALSTAFAGLSQANGVAVDSNGILYIANTQANTVITLNQAPLSFGNVAVGTTSPTTTAAFLFDTAGTLNGSAPYQALLGGAGNLDYAVVAGTGTTCTAGTTFAASAQCTVALTFTPAFPGARNGALLLNGNTGQQSALAYITGTGTAPQIAFAPVERRITGGTYPSAVAVDGAGNVYVASVVRGQIDKETYSNGSYTSTPLGSGFSNPAGVAVDGAGNVFIADGNNIYKETYSNGTYTQSTLIQHLITPQQLWVDGAGNLYIPDSAGRLLKETYANGTYTQSTIVSSGLYNPSAVTVDANGTIYIADNGNNRILKETYANGVATLVATLIIHAPAGVAVDPNGDVYAVTSNGGVLQVFTNSNGTYSSARTIQSGFLYPNGLAIDGAGNLYVGDQSNSRVVVESVTQPPSLSFASTPAGTTSSDSPQAVALFNDGNQPLTVTSAATGSTSFSADPSLCTASPVPAGGVCSLNFSYVPQRSGPAGTSAIVTDNNLNVSGVRQSIKLNGASATQGTQTITFPSPGGGAYAAGTALPLNATSSAGLLVRYALSVTNVTGSAAARVFQNQGVYTVTLTGNGTATLAVTASQQGNADYAAASVTDTFNVSIVPTPPSSAVLADTAIGASSSATVAVQTVATGTLASVAGLTQGAAGLDYAASPSANDACAIGSSLAAGQVCSLNVTFSPQFAGTRYGAVQLLDAGGNLLGMAYLQGNGLGPQATFAPVISTVDNNLSSPQGIAVDGSRSLYISSAYSSTIVKDTFANGAYTRSTITPSFGNNFYGVPVALDGAGNLYLVDTPHQRVVKLTYLNGTYSESNVATGLNYAAALAIDGAGNVYIANTYAQNVLRETYANGTYTQSTIVGSLNYPQGIAVDGTGNVYIADTSNQRLLKETYSGGTYTQSLVDGALSNPVAVAVDNANNLYVASDGAVTKETYANGTYSSSVYSSAFTSPTAVALDGAGNLYVTVAASASFASRLNVTTPPTLTFPNTTATGTTSQPLAATVTNLGNQPLVFRVPASGINPQTAANFSLETNGDTTCPVVNAGRSAGQLAANTTCTLSYLFAPALVGTFTSTSVLTDNTLNVTGATQTITLKGTSTQGTQTAQTITFPQPAPGEAYTTATLAATASSGLPVTYTVSSGPATISGSTIRYTGAGTVTIAADQPGNVAYAAAPQVSVTVTSVIVKNVWALNAKGTVTSFDESGAPGSGPYGVSGQASATGSLAFDASQRAWSVTSGTNFLFSVDSTGANSMIYTGGGIATPRSVAIDGLRQVWVANGSGVISVFTNGGTAVSPSSGYTGTTTAPSASTAAYATPSGIAVDLSGNVWVANMGNNTVTEILGAAAPAAPLATALTKSTTGARP